MRTVARIAMVAGAAGSLALLLRASTHTPRFLLALFVLWVLSPFAMLAWANTTKRWSPGTRVTLCWVTLILALGSLPIYAGLIPRPAGTRLAFVFLMVPLASWVLLILALSVAALASRMRADQVAKR